MASAAPQPLNPKPLFFLVFLFLLLRSPYADADAMELDFHAGDRDALLRFRSELDDLRSGLVSWKGSNCSAWAGVTCQNRTGRVARVELAGLGLSGAAALPFLCRLSLLETLVLHGNAFSGPVPPCLGRLRGIGTLDLGQNKFQGQSAAADFYVVASRDASVGGKPRRRGAGARMGRKILCQAEKTRSWLVFVRGRDSGGSVPSAIAGISRSLRKQTGGRVGRFPAAVSLSQPRPQSAFRNPPLLLGVCVFALGTQLS